MSKIIVIPLTPDSQTKEVNYLMVEKSLYGAGFTQLEFPSGKAGKDESFEDAAKRIFLQETGYEPTWAKFMYAFFANPQESDEKTSVFMGLTLKDSDSAHAVVKMSGDDLLKKIRENDIVDVNTLAAFSAILLQSNEAKKYIVPEAQKEKGFVKYGEQEDNEEV